MIEADRRNAESARAMGMELALSHRWADASTTATSARREHASDVVSTYGSISKMVRLVSQSAILGLGAYLVIRQELSRGADDRSFHHDGPRAGARSKSRLPTGGSLSRRAKHRSACRAMLGRMPARQPFNGAAAAHAHPRRRKRQSCAADVADHIVRQFTFKLTAGEVLGVVGPSGAGKTSLIRALVGVWRAGARGSTHRRRRVRSLGPEHIGRTSALPSQTVELFDGTVAENIARMAPRRTTTRFCARRRHAGVHDMILRLPNGYDTRIGEAE